MDFTPEEWQAIWLTVKVAVVGVIGSLPVAVAGLLSGAVLAFGRSLGEFGATITFVSNIPGETRTIASAIYALLQTPDADSEVLRLCAVSVVLSFVSLIASELLIRAGQR